jgi:hypothetical protein
VSTELIPISTQSTQALHEMIANANKLIAIQRDEIELLKQDNKTVREHLKNGINIFTESQSIVSKVPSLVDELTQLKEAYNNAVRYISELENIADSTQLKRAQENACDETIWLHSRPKPEDQLRQLKEANAELAAQLIAQGKAYADLKNDMAAACAVKDNRIAELETELDAYRKGGLTEEILRRNDGYIKVGNGCAIMLDSDRARIKEMENILTSSQRALLK